MYLLAPDTCGQIGVVRARRPTLRSEAMPTTRFGPLYAKGNNRFKASFSMPAYLPVNTWRRSRQVPLEGES